MAALGRKYLSYVDDNVLSFVDELIAHGCQQGDRDWDDMNGDQVIDSPQECLGGRLQMAEQALTGELGRDGLGRPTADRDGDCVVELAHAQKASVQASEVLFTR